MVEVVGSSPIIFTKYPPYPFGCGGYFSLVRCYRLMGRQAGLPAQVEGLCRRQNSGHPLFSVRRRSGRDIPSSSPRRRKARLSARRLSRLNCLLRLSLFFRQKSVIFCRNYFEFIIYTPPIICTIRKKTKLNRPRRNVAGGLCFMQLVVL